MDNTVIKRVGDFTMTAVGALKDTYEWILVKTATERVSTSQPV